jgi:hypothetical protein
VRERERSREMLRRLQTQRDEAHRVAHELKRHLTPAPGPIAVAGAAVPDQGPESAAPAATAQQGTPAESSIPPEESSRASELAAALAATDPRRRRRGRSSVPDVGASATPSHPTSTSRALSEYSVSDLKPEETTKRPPRRS